MANTFDKTQLDEIRKRALSHLINIKTFSEIVPHLLKLLGESLGCHWAAYWEVDTKVGLLRFVDAWSSTPSKQLDELRKDSETRSYHSGEGMAGRTWRIRKAHWSTDLVKDMMLPRSIKAQDAGFKTGMWFPVQNCRYTYGVFEGLRCESVPLNQEVLKFLEDLGKEFGYFIEQYDTP